MHVLLSNAIHLGQVAAELCLVFLWSGARLHFIKPASLHAARRGLQLSTASRVLRQDGAHVTSRLLVSDAFTEHTHAHFLIPNER